MTTDQTPGFNTRAIHAGARPDPSTGARVTPIYQTTSYVFDDVDHAAFAITHATTLVAETDAHGVTIGRIAS